MPRACEYAIISDCHLGTAAARVGPLLAYLHEIEPETLILNGDLCDLGSYFRRHWPPTHLAVFARLLDLVHRGCDVRYVTGNHDAALRDHPGLRLPGIPLCDRLVIEAGGERLLVTHGDCLDRDVACPGVLRKLGSVGYGGLMLVDGRVQQVRRLCRRPPSRSLATAIKRRVPGTATHIRRFEDAAVALAAREDCDGIVVGHIHQPAVRSTSVDGRAIRYLNSGDWVEHATALEFADGAWNLVGAPVGGAVSLPRPAMAAA